MLRPSSIDHIRGKIKSWAAIMDRKDVYAVSTVVFVGVSSFILGRLSMIDENRPPVTIESFSPESPEPLPVITGRALSGTAREDRVIGGMAQTAAVARIKGLYVGSKSSNKYHLPHCIGAQRISETNKVWFASKADAEKSGYVPAGNCKGI